MPLAFLILEITALLAHSILYLSFVMIINGARAVSSSSLIFIVALSCFMGMLSPLHIAGPLCAGRLFHGLGVPR